ncbi:DUF2254 domain-containing protein [Arthrobacter sp. NicSoilB8]|uniref:DUF2254 domain-containing protein n=1 Tax=Arthrobacter sp. NicSoilB8 TaxID=2830998 RepID=UPI001CC713F9|nr:DUF2254 domain-containing protein [Arthrobacter sp. NicSoilB8]BCW70811.1 hypothetical protein NicSoilB8_18550 [Arthrobacter sp. NicSoilB8]
MIMIDRRAAQVTDAVRTQLWPLPAVAVVVAVVLGIALPTLDAAVDDRLPQGVAALLFGGGPEAARAVLQAIAGSLITVTSLTFSLTVVTLQLASSQFSPRLLRTFSSDRFVHATLALFLATFAFALTVLRSVRTETSQSPAFVPEISVTVAYALTIASIMGLVLFLAHLTREIRVETMMRKVNAETRATMDRVFPAHRPSRQPVPATGAGSMNIRRSRSGFLTGWNKNALLRAAREAGAVIRIDREPGSSLVEGVPFATAWPLPPATALSPETAEQLTEQINAAVDTGFERTNVQDVGFGFRQLSDVAARALSPGINDPTTAVHVIGHLSDLLCRLANRTTGPEVITDDSGEVRVILAQPRFEDLLDLALAQSRQYGAGDPAVAERLLVLLRELSSRDEHAQNRSRILAQVDQTRETIAANAYTSVERRHLLALADAVGSGAA